MCILLRNVVVSVESELSWDTEVRWPCDPCLSGSVTSVDSALSGAGVQDCVKLVEVDCLLFGYHDGLDFPFVDS